MATLIQLNQGQFIPNVNNLTRKSFEEILDVLTINTRFEKHGTIEISGNVRLDGQSKGLPFYNLQMQIGKDSFAGVHLNEEVRLTTEVIELIRQGFRKSIVDGHFWGGATLTNYCNVHDLLKIAHEINTHS